MKSSRLIPIFLVALALVACDSKAPYAGSYETTEDAEPWVRIELKESGQGLWIVEADEDSFTWYVKGGQIRLNTRQGGVLVGQIQPDALRFTLPGGRQVLVRRVE